MYSLLNVLTFKSNPLKTLVSTKPLGDIRITKLQVNLWKYILRRCLEKWVFPVKISFILHLWHEVETKTSLILDKNKNTLTGPANCKKTTRHYAHLSLCGKSRKTNNAKSRKWRKTSIWAIFWRFRRQKSPNCKIFWKIGFIPIEGHI